MLSGFLLSAVVATPGEALSRIGEGAAMIRPKGKRELEILSKQFAICALSFEKFVGLTVNG